MNGKIPGSDLPQTARLATWFRQALEQEARCLSETAAGLGNEGAAATRMVLDCRGKVVIAGMGKMGHVGRKAAATLCSTGTPAVFLHPGEAFHGDLGVVSKGDLLIALSGSGETAEVLELVPWMRRQEVPVIAVTTRPTSALARVADLVIPLRVDREADPIETAPTASTTVALAICDALAVTVMSCRGFTREQFAELHPKGYIGRKLLTTVGDLMRTGERLPLVSSGTRVREAILEMSGKGLGCVFVLDSRGCLAGVFTDGDLRRTLQLAPNPLEDQIDQYMTARPTTTFSTVLAAEAIRLMESRSITVLPVLDPDQRPVGAIHLHDLVQAGLV